ncbi:MAG: hypothetical protein ACR2KP_05855, partial [Egibacteraceae bacterium]
MTAEQDAYARSLGAAEVVVLSEGTTLVDALGARSIDTLLETLGAPTRASSRGVARPTPLLAPVTATLLLTAVSGQERAQRHHRSTTAGTHLPSGPKGLPSAASW